VTGLHLQLVASPLAVFSEFGDAFDFIFSGRNSVAAGQHVGGLGLIWTLTWGQIKVTAVSLAGAIAVSMPVGVILGHRGRGERVALAFGNSWRAVPELAFIAFLAAFFGVSFGLLAAALVVLGVPPILTNSFVAVRQVDPGAVDAARGMGMSEAAIAARIEVPLGVPTIMAGIRTAAINIWATATIAPLVGYRTLGELIIDRNVYGDAGVLAGAILVAVGAIVIDVGLAGLQSALTSRGVRVGRLAGGTDTA
jgi:osmoprotectant transport system permease protein